MSRNTSPSDFTKVHYDELVSSAKPGFYRALVGFWWALDQDGYAYIWQGRMPQANMDKSIVEQIAPRTLHFADIKIVYIPVALVRGME